jgi:hypothetical protein
MTPSSASLEGEGANRPITVHHLIAAVLALVVIVGGGSAHALFSGHVARAHPGAEPGGRMFDRLPIGGMIPPEGI